MKVELYQDYFKNKKITITGLGVLGRGVGDTSFLAKFCDEIIVTDLKDETLLKSSIESLKKFNNIKYSLGGHKMSDFENRDFILKSAGVPFDSEYIVNAKKNNIPIFMSAGLVSKIVMDTLPNVNIIGVTGTRGKSTTTHFIAHILEKAGNRVHTGGNIRGIANLPLLEQINDDDFLVLELDSWQLQGFGDLKISPNISVFTSFLDDHMTYYKNDKFAYFSDKANIFKYQKEYDVLIASKQAFEEIKKYSKDKVKATVPKIKNFDMKLIGEHNQISASLAYEVAFQCGIEEVTILDAISTFNGVEGRLEDMGVFRGVRVFNDNNATTPDAAIAGIKSINEKYNIKPIIILGGGDKGLGVSLLEDEIKINTKEHILLSGAGSDKLNLSKEYTYEELKDCVEKAFELAKEGDIILFSPAFVSFSKYFNNEYERNDEFVKLIKNYATI